MKQKMHLYLIMFALSVIGVASLQQITVANQELVLHFTNVEATSQQAETTISQLKNQLLELGVKNIQLKNDDRGKLTIRYYSDLDVASIKKVLSKDQSLKLDYPINNHDKDKHQSSNDDSIGYNLDIFEIQNVNDLNSGLDGCIVIKKSESDRYYDPNSFFLSSILNNKKEESIVRVSFKVWNHIETSIDNISYIFPEVRAGPNSLGNS